MRILKIHPLLSILNSYLIDSPQPANISYLWNYGSLLGLCLIIQIITGVTLAMHYIPSIDLAFLSVEHIMWDVNYGWLIRYIHSNTASFFFLFVYIHIAWGIYYGSYRTPRILVWSIGVVIFLIMIVIAFLGYVLPFGQMSLWGATVITNLMSAIPWIGNDIVNFIWGGFSVNHATLNWFFSLHYLLPFVLLALVVAHLISLHVHGSSNPLGVTGNSDRLPFHPYFSFKDLVTVFLFLLALSFFVFYAPNVLGHSDNYIMANPMATPPSIVPEWYLLPFYAILWSISNKLFGVVAMLAAILILFVLPLVDLSWIWGSAFRPLSKFFFWIFVTNFFLLMFVGSQHVEEPFVTLGQYATFFYFFYFLVVIPLVGIIENTLVDLALIPKKVFLKL
uniref:Cytochrome b n=1 Tax=Pneumocystis jirovecii TaxID=42068 RepID=A0A2S0X1A8_PNEJI|nr:apocytochrome b [Pneumocystis jirovecii]